MWSVNALEIINLGRTPGGKQFTELIDALICTQGMITGIPYSKIATNIRTNKPDGGVDTKVDDAIKKDATGWFSVKTIWQYKAKEQKDVSESDLKNEINKDYANECISKEYAYRFCICDSLTAQKKEDWETKLTEFAREINSKAQKVMVLTADDLARWINQFPALILRFFRPSLRDVGLHINAWKDNATKLTRVFVSVAAWEPVTKEIRNYLDLSTLPSDVVLTVQGLAGVGKTRLVYEVIAELSGTEGLVIYTNDERSVQNVARHLANNKSLRAILVADECSVQTRVQLANLLTRTSRNQTGLNKDLVFLYFFQA